MDAPTYTLFSNTTSMRAWNKDNPSKPVMSLESPHNFIHLAVGGFDIPAYNASPISGANGDMGENDTAALDPIFYFHHCFIDYAFWIWQRRHGCTTSLSIDDQDPGASYANKVSSASPTARARSTRSPLPPTRSNRSNNRKGSQRRRLGRSGSAASIARRSPARSSSPPTPTSTASAS